MRGTIMIEYNRFNRHIYTDACNKLAELPCRKKVEGINCTLFDYDNQQEFDAAIQQAKTLVHAAIKITHKGKDDLGNYIPMTTL